MTALPETIPVREAHRFPTAALEAFLAGQGQGRLTDLRQMRGGQSNPTFLIVTETGEYVLRKQPPGKLLPSAHAVDREFRVLQALSRTDVPVPRAVAFCADPAVIGTPFYLMERLQGRVFWDPALPELPREERAPIYFAMNEALARLHRVDPAAIGLSDFGRAGNYFRRQIERWSGQWAASKTRENPAIDHLAAWLPAHIPEDDETRICHGDFRLDNMIFHPSEARVIGIIDWELATLGHPLADLAYNCIAYNTDPTVYRGIRGRDLDALGIPSQEAYVRRYCERTGRRDGITSFHLAFALFRLAVILEGVLARAKAGNASSADASEKGALGIALAERGWELARG
ncbi:phosphotransferase [Methylobacterium nodulans]|uniref:Aminoglycoside phosphotransferase n=1 Tax=Methylobacterium nodulans (strain LMG 21967 / CNCM I-2342 / ORS 2060) TaxID=460265 RepID=B8ICW6_METNO|nr:phosphotransferase [Methylobacterium nodulans]ACL59358.1 aminoglycoside phosphotransferase [Methylobacterium nodulans ORS 2060]